MKITANTSVHYTPKWKGNRELPKKEQISITLKMPSILEAKQLTRLEFTQGGATRIHNDVKKILSDHVGAIENLSLCLDGNTSELERGVDLANSRATVLAGLVDEITTQVLYGDSLSEIQQKN